MTRRICCTDIDGIERPHALRKTPASVSRYIFKLNYATRSLPTAYATSVAEEVRAAIDEAVEHHVELGYRHSEAYRRVFTEFMAPDRLGKTYVAAYHRRPAALPGVAEAAVLFCGSTCAAVMISFSAHELTDHSLAAAMAFASIASALRLAPVTRWLRLRQAAARFINRAIYFAMPVASAPALASLQAQFTLTLSPPSLAAHFSLSHVSTTALFSIATLFVLERSRRTLKTQHQALHRLLDDRGFAANYFRLTERELEERKRFGYYTESVE